MLSIGEIVDKLVIENMKIFSLRERIHNEQLSDEKKVELNEAMITLNTNRGIISQFLDEKVARVLSGQEQNITLKKIKTYNVKT